MKKIIGVLLAVLLLTACGEKEEREVLRVFNWGEFIDESQITAFEKEYHAKVIYERYGSNEQMYQKLFDGSDYDIIVPSDYMIQRLVEEDRLQKIDFSKLSNYDGVFDFLKNNGMDYMEEYSVPYFWGNVGILYHKDRVELEELEEKSWNIFKDPKYRGRFYFYDSERDAFMVALKALGFSANTNDSQEIKEAYYWLEEMMEEMDPVFATDEIVDNLGSEMKDFAVVYSGDASLALLDYDHLAYFVPEDSNKWIDAMVIPKDAPNPDLAHKWIDFILREDVAKANSEEIAYASPVESVAKALTSQGGMFEGNDAYWVRFDENKDEFFKHDEKLKKIMSEYWAKIKAFR